MVKPVFLASLLVGTVSAQRGRPTQTQPQRGNPQATQSLYGQCAGQAWTGPTACPTGAFCRNVDNNIWYSQCVPNDAPAPAEGPDAVAEIRTTTTIFSVDWPYPTIISTRITYLQPRPTRTTQSPVEVVTVTLVPDEPCEHEYYC